MELENVILDKDICIQEQMKDHEQRQGELMNQLNKSETAIQGLGFDSSFLRLVHEIFRIGI
jgi:hypothetical protein